jgi:hypothetical protein
MARVKPVVMPILMPSACNLFGCQLLDAQDVRAMESEEPFQGWTPLGPSAGTPQVVRMGDEGEGRHGFSVLEYLEGVGRTWRLVHSA